jgi:hypothetical protein
MQHWKTTIAGILLGGVQAILAVSDFHTLTWQQLVLRFGLAAASVALGILAKDR